MTLYPIGTIINCNRCDKPFPLHRSVYGASLNYDDKFPNQAVRLHDFTTCSHCQVTDTHWVYARNNPRTPEVEFKVCLLEITFETSEQMNFMWSVMRANNIPTVTIGTGWTLQFSNVADAELAITLIAQYIEKRNRAPK